MKLKRHKKIIILSVLIIALGIFAGVFWQIIDPQGTNIGQMGEMGTSAHRVNVLLVGADKRPGEEKYNTDAIVLASVDSENKRICLLSIPRDTKVRLKGIGDIKINAVVAQKGYDELKLVVRDLTGVSVDGYVETNFSGFKTIIDTLGGITVNVEKDMYYETGDKEDGYIHLHKGEQRLNGSQALQYARFRYDALADISRTARQQVIMKAVASEMFKLSTLPKLPVLIPQLAKCVQTDLNPTDMLKLAKTASSFKSDKILSQTLPGTFLDQNGVSYWSVDPVIAKRVVKDLFNGITTDKVINGENIDLLGQTDQSSVKSNGSSVPIAPGSPLDPNGSGSTGYRELERQKELGGGA